jgi:hypothetical protein
MEERSCACVFAIRRRQNLLSALQVGGVPDRDEAVAKRQHLADQAARLVPVMQHERVDAA